MTQGDPSDEAKAGVTLRVAVVLRGYLEGGSGVKRRGAAEPARGAAEVGVPGLVDQPRGGGPGRGLPQVVEPIGCLGVQPHTEVVVEQPFHLGCREGCCSAVQCSRGRHGCAAGVASAG